MSAQLALDQGWTTPPRPKGAARADAASVRVVPGKRSPLRLSAPRRRSDAGPAADALFRVLQGGDSATPGSRRGAGETAARADT